MSRLETVNEFIGTYSFNDLRLKKFMADCEEKINAAKSLVRFQVAHKDDIHRTFLKEVMKLCVSSSDYFHLSERVLQSQGQSYNHCIFSNLTRFDLFMAAVLDFTSQQKQKLQLYKQLNSIACKFFSGIFTEVIYSN